MKAEEEDVEEDERREEELLAREELLDAGRRSIPGNREIREERRREGEVWVVMGGGGKRVSSIPFLSLEISISFEDFQSSSSLSLRLSNHDHVLQKKVPDDSVR